MCQIKYGNTFHVEILRNFSGENGEIYPKGPLQRRRFSIEIFELPSHESLKWVNSGFSGGEIVKIIRSF